MLLPALMLASAAAAARVAGPAPCAAQVASVEDLEGCQRRSFDAAAGDYAKANAGKLPPEGLLAVWAKVQARETRLFRAKHPQAAREETVVEEKPPAIDKRFNVYVAPWCPHCRDATDTIIRLRDMLAQRGIKTRIVVGGDSQAKCEEYAAKFGEDAVTDPAGSLMPNGVPHFTVTKGDGTVLKEMAGFAPDSDADQLAAALDLP